jgi:hypothetical protein
MVRFVGANFPSDCNGSVTRSKNRPIRRLRRLHPVASLQAVDGGGPQAVNFLLGQRAKFSRRTSRASGPYFTRLIFST